MISMVKYSEGTNVDRRLLKNRTMVIEITFEIEA